MNGITQYIPTQWVPYVTGAIAIGSGIAYFMQPPAATGWTSSTAYRYAYEVVQWCAINKGQATNANYPGSKP